MSKVKLKHASGNSMSIAAPATNPASDLELKLPPTIGTAGQVLKNSSTAGTLEFGGGGKILQVVKGTALTAIKYDSSTTFTNMSDTLPSVTITPAATSSKIFVTFTGNFHCDDAGDTWYATLKRDIGGTVTDLGNATNGLAHGNAVADLSYGSATMTVLDEPGTTSACKYQVYFRNNNDDSSAAYHVVLGGGQHGGTNTMPSYVIAMEVGA